MKMRETTDLLSCGANEERSRSNTHRGATSMGAGARVRLARDVALFHADLYCERMELKIS